MLSNLFRPVLLGVVLFVSIAFSWSINGVVVSNKGGSLQGAIVSVTDGAESFADTTDANGYFSLESQVIAIPFASVAKSNSLKMKIHGNVLEVSNTPAGMLHFSLTDVLGKVYWNQEAAGGFGTIHLSLPDQFGVTPSFLRVQGTHEKAVLYKVNRNGSLALVTSAYPELQFHKAGFQDTTYVMQAAVETNVSVVMRDTTQEVVACSAQKLASGDYYKTITVGGVSREYILHVPTQYNGENAVPLVVDFHPIMGSDTSEFNSSPYKAETDPEGVITAYPNGLKGPTGMRAWNVGPCCTDADDTSFARAVVAEVKKTACIDSKRVYATGFSMGGGMTHYSACHLADIFAAAAPAAFDLAQENEKACTPSRPISVISFRSTGDQTVFYDGRYSDFVSGKPLTFLGAVATFTKWATLDQCTGSPSAADGNGCSTYSNCAGGVSVTLCTKQGGSHEYGNAKVGWPWLKQYTLP